MPLLSSASIVTLTMEVRELWPAVIISALSQGDFGGDVLVRNRIFKLHGSELPTFLQDFRLELKRPRWIEPDAVRVYHSVLLVIEDCCRSLVF